MDMRLRPLFEMRWGGWILFRSLHAPLRFVRFVQFVLGFVVHA